MNTSHTILTRGTAVVAASALALALAQVPAQADESGGSIDTSATLLQTSAELQTAGGGGNNLGNIAGLLGSLAGVAEGDMNATQMVAAMSSFYQAGGLDYLAGIPGGLHDFVQTCMRAIAGQATIDDVWRQFNAIGAPQQHCNDLSDAGGYGGVYRRIDMGRGGPMTIPLRFETFSIPDAVNVYYEGRHIYGSGFVGTNGDRWVDVMVPPGASTSVIVEVLAPDRSTEWNYTVHCPR